MRSGIKLRVVLVAGGLGPPPAPERPGFAFSGRLRASDSTTIAPAFASADADRDDGGLQRQTCAGQTSPGKRSYNELR